jgi:hypothetical protein
MYVGLGNDFEDDLDAIFFNLVASIIPQWRTFLTSEVVVIFEPISGFGWNFVLW